MNARRPCIVVFLLTGLTLAGAGCRPDVPGAPTYFGDVRPILMANCVLCHGSQVAVRPSDVLDGTWSIDGWDPVVCDTPRIDESSGQVIADALRDLIVRLAGEDGAMPPSDSEALATWNIDFSPGALPDHQREVLRRWAAAGFLVGTPPPDFPVTPCSMTAALPDPPPAVTARSPDDGATDVLRNVAVYVVFDAGLDPATIDSPAPGFWAEAGAGPVAASVTYSPGELKATLVSAAPFDASVVVTVHLETTITSALGVPLAAPMAWSFTTGTTLDTTPPTFAGITSAADNGDGTATLGWNEAADDTTAPPSITYVIYEAGDLSSPIGSVAGSTTYRTPAYAAGAYVWAVRAHDSAGNEDANTASAGATITIPMVSFSGEVLPLFVPTCTGVMCHDAMAPQRGMNLTASAAYGELVGVPSVDIPSMDRVEPGDPMRSYLYLKLTGDPMILGTQMPGGMEPDFTAAQLETIRFWILNGALND